MFNFYAFISFLTWQLKVFCLCCLDYAARQQKEWSTSFDPYTVHLELQIESTINTCKEIFIKVLILVKYIARMTALGWITFFPKKSCCFWA